MAVKHKEIKRCKMITQCLVQAGLGPGTLFQFADYLTFNIYNVEVDAENVVVANSSLKFLPSYSLIPKEPILFIDVVYDSALKNHFLRFLHHERMISLTFRKGETIKLLKMKNLTKNSSNEPLDEKNGK